jgi:hypothetical protein
MVRTHVANDIFQNNENPILAENFWWVENVEIYSSPEKRFFEENLICSHPNFYNVRSVSLSGPSRRSSGAESTLQSKLVTTY